MIPQRVALVTGASRGIGAATAVELARQGHDVSLVARDEPALLQVQRAVEAVGRTALVFSGDLADLEFAETAVRQTVAQWGRLDVLVNNAAWREITTMRRISLESWERTLRIGLTTPAFLARWAAETMQPQGRGVIINVSSIMSQQAAGTSPAYIASKGGLESLTYELAALYGPKGIRVLAISPGAIDTELSRDYTNSTGENLTLAMRSFSEDMIALSRWGSAEEIARVIAMLASDAASYLSGTVIVADGGWQHQHLPLTLRGKQFPQDFA
jgi:NAD(P)-dependent dehydrogenase (short-subunit alcohol dehydrogenase family)